MLPQLVKYLLIAFGTYHFVAGSFVLGPKSWIQGFGKKVYQLEIQSFDVKYFICLKFLGAMAWMVAALSLLMAFTTDKYVQILALIFFGILFQIRALLRYLYRREMLEAYQLTFQRNLKNIIFNIFLSLLTFALAWTAYASL